MCNFCGMKDCNLTKAEVLERGAIIESNVESIMRSATDSMPQTYFFKGVPAYNSYSALFPDEEEESPHAFTRFVFDEDEGCGDGWETWEIQNPLTFQTEKELDEKILSSQT